ncbi:DUF397 domain-containing protein [Streptosporangium sandarakinum]|uniref:DUF397 domain-containing protein n=1 Tax=Streptosporangium sandarakinum TaxID=1260955 RepID=A0A852UPW9_9ACTN|nr:DUF397 domain-containing protein [Streptosporangium sandarakinum]NYF39527.1 hypothetical protein [Streptosporangium sandarakinum]
MSETSFSSVVWRKSSLSGAGQNCVEVGVWRKSSISGNGSNCVEVAAWQQTTGSDTTGGQCMEVVRGTSSIEAQPDRLFLVRDSKDPDGPVLSFPPTGWNAFLSAIKSGGLDALV